LFSSLRLPEVDCRTIEVKKHRSDFHDRFIYLGQCTGFSLTPFDPRRRKQGDDDPPLEDKRKTDAALKTFQTAWVSANPVPL
jgi:hypothetical protein